MGALPMETYYAILEIEESATPDEIKNAHRLLLQVWHPDRFHQSPKLLAKAEQKTGKINMAFETLGTSAMKQRYDEWLRANHGWKVQAGTVTCPSCRTSFQSHPELTEKREFRPDQHRKRNNSEHAAGGGLRENERFTPLQMAMVVIGILFSGIIVFAFTKSSKVIASYKPAPPAETVTLSEHEPPGLKEEEQIRRAAATRESASSRPAQPQERATFQRTTPSTDAHQERSQLETMQRLMAQAPARVPAPSEGEPISDVDLQQLKMRSAQGNASAQNQLGQLYENGRRGVPQDYVMAQGWYEKAAVQGNGWAQNQLGQMFADGRGVPQNYEKARQWWAQAAALGVAQAQYNLGQLYANGRGAPQDYTMARDWYEKAAAQGNAWAQAQLGQLYANGRGVPKNTMTARGWYEKAAAKGNAWARAQLALL
jgi:curved DNA-binding protein CbpA